FQAEDVIPDATVTGVQTCALPIFTCTSLLLVRRSVHRQVKKEIFADLQNSVSTFQNFQRERELSLSRSAELLADLPTLRALMTKIGRASWRDSVCICLVGVVCT